MKTKQQVIKEEITPLMLQIGKICVEHNIANVMAFSGERETQVSVLVTKNATGPAYLHAAAKLACRRSEPADIGKDEESTGNDQRRGGRRHL